MLLGLIIQGELDFAQVAERDEGGADDGLVNLLGEATYGKREQYNYAFFLRKLIMLRRCYSYEVVI